MAYLRITSTTNQRFFLLIIEMLLLHIVLILGQFEEGFCTVNYNTTQQCKILEDFHGSHLRDYFTEWKENMKTNDLSKYDKISNTGGRNINSSGCLINKCLSDEKSYTKEVINPDIFDWCIENCLRSDWLNEFNEIDDSKVNYKFFQGNVCYDKLEILTMAVRSPRNDETNGIVDFLSKDDIFMSASLVDGCVHGLSKSLWCDKGNCGGNEEEKSQPDLLDTLMVYTEDHINEEVYTWYFSAIGALYCTLNINGRAEGKDCVFLYSDIKSGIVGTWRDGAMIHGKPAILKNFTINSEYGLLQPEMEILEGRQEYTFYESTNNTLTPDTMLSDIYEDMHVFVAPSSMENAGEGLFTKTPLKKGDLVAAVNGLKISIDEVRQKKELRTSRYIVGSWDDFLIDVPKVYRSTTNYVASLGHKANGPNKGEPYNAYFSQCDHPRFGEITCVIASRDIEPYEEILSFYGEIYWSQLQECNL